MPDIYFPHLGIAFQNVNVIAISIFGFNIYWYAVFIMLGVIAGYVTATIEAKRSGQNPEIYTDMLFVGLIAAFIGLRLFYVAFNWELFRHDPITIITGIRDGGLAIFGGIIATLIATAVFARKRRLNVWLMLDTGMPSFALGQAIGRWGNFFNREAFGCYTDNLFAMRMVRDQVRGPITPDIAANTVISQGVEYIQVHPAFLYESLWTFGIFAALTLFRPHKKYDGQVFWLYLLGYGLARFFIESLRTDQLMLGPIPISQMMAALIFIPALLALAHNKYRNRHRV